MLTLISRYEEQGIDHDHAVLEAFKERLVSENFVAALWDGLEDGQDEIKVERQLSKKKKCNWQASCCI